MDDDDSVNNDDFILGFCCGGAVGSFFFPRLVNFRYEVFRIPSRIVRLL